MLLDAIISAVIRLHKKQADEFSQSVLKEAFTMKICYFTATGNSLYAAERLCEKGGELLSIPQLMKQKEIHISDDAVGIVCPIYAGDMPKMVRSFLEKAEIHTDYFFFVYTYGMSETAARAHALQEAEKVGLKLRYENAIKMVDNYLPGFEMADQEKNAGKKEIEKQIDQTAADLASRKESVVSINVSTKIKEAVVGKMYKAIMKDNAAQQFIVDNDACVRCGTCAKVCPAENITVTDHVAFSDHCQVCYACLHNCPKNAIHLKNEKSSARFRNEHVTLNDIISSNQ